MLAPESPSAPRCPACSYDLTGIVESWAEACPVRGICPECGGEILWSGILVPGPRPPSWSFEHGGGPQWRRAAATLARLIEPLSFWHAMRGARESRPSRVAALVVAAASIGVLACGLSAAWSARGSLAGAPRLSTARHFVVESYGDAREPLIYLTVWLLGSIAGVACFRRRGEGFGPALASAALYAAAGLALVWSLLAMAMMLDAQFLMVFGVSTQIGSGLLALVVLAAWLWLIAGWYGAVRWRLPVRRAPLAWLLSQAAASGLVLGFSFLDRYLPF